MDKLIKSIELNALKLLSNNFELISPDDAANGGSLEFSCSVNFVESKLHDHFDMIAKFEMHGFNEGKDLFRLEQEFISTYQILDQEVFDEILEKIKIQHCLSLIFPILREDALKTLSRAGLGQIDIPLHFSSPKIAPQE
jgi:preprotein translocase subunit SecB